MTWSLPYTTHLGYLPPEFRPQFAATVGSTDVTANVLHAAELGLAGVLYPWAAERPTSEVEEVGRSLKTAGLACSCVVSVPLDATFGGPWTQRSPTGRAALERHVATAAAVAGSLGSTVLAALVTADPERDVSAQLDDTASNLHAMASIAADHGMTLAVEPMVALPGMLVTTVADTVSLIKRADHRALGLIFDTAHVAAMDGDIRAAWAGCAEHVALLQLVDEPGRVEPGAGTLPLVGLASDAVSHGYSGLVDLEHEWAGAGVDGEAAGLARLREFDESVRLATSGSVAGDAGPGNTP
ncbi:sugar phosphate isomerase/epimerase family protein [Pseudonocardia alni]|uniref:sugar phosphate isomerase/epimerase family protein n=1 Tax=Pseudonocardia alni TaxID=33907 RepID=UPI00280A929C|nr:sugar phosphate isomerase/epimerase family protein [Pseudonocardia alni]